MSQFYIDPDYSTETSLPNAETFFVGPREILGVRTGWYWWACFPGCLPDGEASGPFRTEAGAIKDARSLNHVW
jgi:hypothetical protein